MKDIIEKLKKEDKKNKIEFLKKNYGIKEEQIFFVKS